MPKQRIRIYHNPKCTKSRQALALLRERGIDPEVVEYLKTPLTADQVKQLVGMLKILPHDLLRTKEAPYTELGLSKTSSLEAIARAIEQAPILMERPVIVSGKRAVIGRPTEKVLELL
jgi:arsenate reductase